MKSLILSLQKKSELCTGLSNQVEMHIMQDTIFGYQKFVKLEEKYSSHAKEEREFQKKFASRILDLGGKVELQQREASNLIEDPIEFLKADLEISKDGVASLDKLVEASITDHISYDLLKEYYKDEAEDLLWSETELELIEKIGKGNWLLLQL